MIRKSQRTVESARIGVTLIEMTALLLTLSLICHVAAASAPPIDRVSYAGESVIRVKLKSVRDVRLIEALSTDMWSHGIYGGQAEYQVSREQRIAIDTTSLEYCVMIDDLDAAIVAEGQRLETPPADGGVADLAWFAQAKDLAAINTRLDVLAAIRPDLAQVVVVGTSLEGRPIRGLRISALPVGTPAPAILFDATQHAREWAAAMTGMFCADQLIELADLDPRIHTLLSQIEFFVIPVVNPDGYNHSWTTARLWRKNRRDNGNGTFGVDLNRNWDFQWGGAGASTDPASETYRGPSAFSEPESAAMRDFYAAHPNIVANIDFHAYSQLILAPWGYTTAPNADAALFQSIGDAMKGAIASETGANYTVGPIGTTLYLASGGSVDWSYGARGALSWTLEVRDTGAYGFLIPDAEILPCVRENFAAALTMAELAGRPVVISLPTAFPSSIASGVATTLSVRLREAVPGSIATRTLMRRVNGQSWQSTPLTLVSAELFSAVIPAAACGAVIDCYIDVALVGGSSVRYPATAPAALLTAAVVSEQVLVDEPFEVAAAGWSYGIAGDTATSGVWTRGDPIATIAQSEDDHSLAPGVQCAFTGQGTVGGAAGGADVDGGITSLRSPALASMQAGSRLQYWYWYSNNLGGAPNLDEFVVQLSANGTTWTTAATVQSSATAWRLAEIALDGLIPVGSSIFVKFVAQDLNSGSLVEAAIDDVRIVTTACATVAGDANGDGMVNGQDLSILLSQWGSAGSADFDGDGSVAGPDLAVLLSNWS